MALYNQLVAQAEACINPGFRFYQQKFSVQFHNIVRAFKAARLCCPIQVQALHPTAASVQELKQFSFITDAELELYSLWKSCQTIWPLLMVQPLKQRQRQSTVVGYTCRCSPKLVCCSQKDLVGAA